mgnify:CR=1 FL=1
MNTFRQSNGVYTNITTLLPTQQWSQQPGNSMSLNNLTDFQAYLDELIVAFERDLDSPRRTASTEDSTYRKNGDVKFYLPGVQRMCQLI